MSSLSGVTEIRPSATASASVPGSALPASADPVIGVHRLYHSKQIRPGTVFVNETGWSSPKADELMDQATVEVNPRKRAALYKELQKIVVEGSPLVWVHELQFVTVYNKQFKDVIVSPLGLYASFDRAHSDK